MNILTIDTALDTANYAIRTSDKDYVISAPKEAKHSESALKYIDELLQESGLNIQDIDVFGVNVGPGSFTGIRIGMSLCKGFLACIDKPVVAFTSLDVIGRGKQGVVVLRACKDDFYAGDSTTIGADNLRIMTNEEVEQAQNIIEGQSLDAKVELDIVEQAYLEGRVSDIDTLAPIYLKLSQAERQFKGCNSNG